jgi:ABC-type transport system substrate-binding protein
VAAAGDQQIVIRLRQPSPFLLDALEVPVPKPGTTLVGTGPFSVDNADSPTEMRANDHYSQGRPSIAQIVVTNYPSVRAAWAELLRGQLDMLYEVGADALDSLEASSQISIFTTVRRYQYAVVLNRRSDVFRSKSVRRALNMAVDRAAIVRDALNSHGVVSSGPVWLHNYGLRPGLPQFNYDIKQATDILAAEPGHAKRLHFTCIIRPDALTERIALVLKRQLAEAGVDMAIEETPLDQFTKQVRGESFEAALIEVISGPTLLRPYRLWHSDGYFNTKSPAIDAALDKVRYSASIDEYQNAVGGFQQAMMDDPPAIFLAWMERARAVSKRFKVPPVESGRDILLNLPFWKPAGAAQRDRKN